MSVSDHLTDQIVAKIRKLQQDVLDAGLIISEIDITPSYRFYGTEAKIVVTDGHKTYSSSVRPYSSDSSIVLDKLIRGIMVYVEGYKEDKAKEEKKE
jgi:hypothetical protein